LILDNDIMGLIREERTRPDEPDNNVLRRLLGLPHDGNPWRWQRGRWYPVCLPHGTKLRMTHNGHSYTAVVDQGSWLLENGKRTRHPSTAFSLLAVVRGTADVRAGGNGWLYWYAKVPREDCWTRLNKLRRRSIP